MEVVTWSYKMIRLTIIFALLTDLCLGQTNLDYQLYSRVIVDFINEGIEQDVKTDQVVIINRYIPSENHASFYGKEFIESDEQLINMMLHYDSVKLRLFKNNDVINAIRMLEMQFLETPSLNKAGFKLSPQVSTITARRFERFFKTLFGRRIDLGWKRFYKKYAGSHGVFEFSKIVYSGNFACFYAGRHSGSLSGSGDLVIAEKNRGGNWSIASYVNVWMN